MSISQEDLLQDLSASLADSLGGGPSSEEGLGYARKILAMNIGVEPSTSGIDSLRTQQKGVLGALQKARERILAQSGPTRGEKLLAIGAGLGAPTATGSIGETAGNVSRNLLPIAQEQRRFEMGRGEALSSLDLAEAQVFGPVTEAEIDLDKLKFEQSQQNLREALKTISRGSRKGKGGGSAGSRTREAKIQDLISEWGYTRRNASALVDGFVGIEIVPETGMALLTNEIDKTVTEVPRSSIDNYFSEDGNWVDHFDPSGSVDPNEPDRRTDEEKDAGLYVTQAFRAGASLYDMAEVGTGPISGALAGLSIPSSLLGGPVAVETLIARQGLKLRSKDLVRSLIDNPRMPVRLVEMTLEDISLSPDLLTTGPMMQAKMISLDQYLYSKYLDYRRFADDVNAPRELREIGATNSRAMGKFLRDLGVPPDLRRRSPFVPLVDPGDEGAADIPTLAPRGVDQDIWDVMSTPEKGRYIFLTKDLATQGEP